VRGKRAHDARIAALILAHDVRTLLTGNARHHEGWDGLSVLTRGEV
jgi:hypothetical protein